MVTQKKIESVEKPENALATIESNPELMKLYQDNAEVGNKNLAAALPFLKVHSTGKSSTNVLANGEEPQNGYFFYTPTQEEFKDIECHVLTISQGFKTKALQEGKKDVFNQILAGVIINDGEFKPFLMYFQGLKLQNLWTFGKEANPYTHYKPVPIPLFAMKVRLTSEKVKTDYGMSWVVKFQIERGMNGFPLVEMDVEKVKQLRDAVDTVEASIDQLIMAKTTDQIVISPSAPPEDDLTEGLEIDEDAKTINGKPVENVDPKKIPF